MRTSCTLLILTIIPSKISNAFDLCVCFLRNLIEIQTVELAQGKTIKLLRELSCAVLFPYSAFPSFPFLTDLFAYSSTLTPCLLTILTHTSFALRYLYFH